MNINEIIRLGITIAPFTWGGIFSTLFCGFVVGLERQISAKPIGIRTSMLICLGTYLFVVVSNSISNTSTDPSRIIGQIIAGIGFLGAGVIMTRNGIVVGVTSAASIWVLAAIGVTTASHHYFSGIKMAFLVVLILVGIDRVEDTFKALQQGVYKKLHLKYKEQ